MTSTILLVPLILGTPAPTRVPKAPPPIAALLTPPRSGWSFTLSVGLPDCDAPVRGIDPRDHDASTYASKIAAAQAKVVLGYAF